MNTENSNQMRKRQSVGIEFFWMRQISFEVLELLLTAVLYTISIIKQPHSIKNVFEDRCKWNCEWLINFKSIWPTSLMKSQQQLQHIIFVDIFSIKNATRGINFCYLFSALSISMVTRTERAKVIGFGWENMEQSIPSNRVAWATHCEWCV